MSPHLIVWILNLKTMLWPASGSGLKKGRPLKGLGMEAPDYQAGAHFEALDEGVLTAAFKSTGYFFPISISLKVRCVVSVWSIASLKLDRDIDVVKYTFTLQAPTCVCLLRAVV